MVIMSCTVQFDLGGKSFSFETGRLAKQSDGSVLVRSGKNLVLVTVVSSHKPSSFGFFPLTVEIQDRFYAIGRIPGGFFKREGRPNAETILNCRLVDRPLRPCFPENYQNETQIVATVLSYDQKTSLTSLAIMGASAALQCSDIPFSGPVGALQLARVNKKFILNPSFEELKSSDMNLFIAGSEEGIVMVEGEADFVSEAEVLEALDFAHKQMVPIFKAQKELVQKKGNVAKREVVISERNHALKDKLSEDLLSKLTQCLEIRTKVERYKALADLKNQFVQNYEQYASLCESKEDYEAELYKVIDELKYSIVRKKILEEKTRIDQRSLDQVRPISCTVGELDMAHGSAVFTRGETQVLSAVTLGASDDEQSIDSLNGYLKKRFLLHYNFPPFCVGEAGRMGGQSRREVGHGFLAERALQASIPEGESFPYTLRVVGEVLESNGSSSMGTVCAGTLALMDAGVPIHAPVAGIAMGLISEGDQVAILSDILGDEDHLGDMDFKVAGSTSGITALQMDIKIKSLSFKVLEKALMQAKEGRVHILNEMMKTLSEFRKELSPYAPRFVTIKVPEKKVRDIIGPGGKVIRSIIDETGAKIDIEDSGDITIFSVDGASLEKAQKMIEDICAEAQVGVVYHGKVNKITDFGAFIEILPQTVGLLHISEVANERVREMRDFFSEGDEVDVKVLDVDHSGRIKLSRKAVLNSEQKNP